MTLLSSYFEGAEEEPKGAPLRSQLAVRTQPLQKL